MGISILSMLAGISMMFFGSGVKEAKHLFVIKELHITDVRCAGQSTGAVTIIAEGGKQPYYYSMNGANFQTEPHFSGLKSGDHKLYVKDSGGESKEMGFVVNQPQKIHFLAPKYTQASCCYSDGAVLVKAGGGVGNMEYQLNDSPFQTSGYFNGLSGGYTIVAKDSLGCMATQVITIGYFNGPVIDFINSTDVSCFGGSNATVAVMTIGGSGELQYSINGGKSYQKETTFKQLAAGKYTIRVKDESGCLDSNTLVISQPPAMEVVATSTCLPGANQKNDIHIEYSIGGRGIHMYSINNKDFQEKKTFKAVDPGTYTIYVKDAAGCRSSTKISCSPAYMLKRNSQ
jgi:hypothetical protein